MRVISTLAAVIGVPSISSLALLADMASSRALHRPLFARSERRMLLWTMVIASLVLYPSVLGFIDIDVYRLGFSTVAPLAIAAAGIALAAKREFRLACLALAVLIAIDIQLLPSSNVFDYVVDPIGALAAVTWASARALMRVSAGTLRVERESGAAGGRPAAE